MRQLFTRLSFGAVLLSLSVSLYAQEPFEVDGIRYYITSDITVEVISKDGEYSGDIVIPETVKHKGKTYSVTMIGYYAFKKCTGLKSLTIGKNVTYIGVCAFNGAFDNLTTVTSLNSIPPELSPLAIDNATYKVATLYVPKGSKTLYLQNWFWKRFNNIVEIDEQTSKPVGDANGDSTVNAADIVEMVNYIMGNDSELFVFKAADANQDGIVNAADIVIIVSMIMNDQGEDVVNDGDDISFTTDDSEYFEITINGESSVDENWSGAWLANFTPKVKDSQEVYPYGGLSEQISISSEDGLQYEVLVGFVSEDLCSIYPKPIGTYDVISSRGAYIVSDYSDNVGMVICGGNMSRRTITSGFLEITKVSKVSNPYIKDFWGRDSYASEGTFSFILTDNWDGNENEISGRFRIVF